MPDAGGGYQVTGDELTTHAGKVDALAARLGTAVAAARQVTMGNSAYGVICQPFALLLDPFEQLGVQAVQQAQESVADSAEKVRTAAGKYSTQEGAASTTVTTAGDPNA